MSLHTNTFMIRCALLLLTFVLALACETSSDDDELQTHDAATKEKADAGESPNDTDAASAAEPDSAVALCESRNCVCTMLCEKIEMTDCSADPPKADCVTACVAESSIGCDPEKIALTECRASRTQLAFSCDPDSLQTVTTGCTAEQDALVACATGG